MMSKIIFKILIICPQIFIQHETFFLINTFIIIFDLIRIKLIYKLLVKNIFLF